MHILPLTYSPMYRNYSANQYTRGKKVDEIDIDTSTLTTEINIIYLTNTVDLRLGQSPSPAKASLLVAY
jgi:hypothetical protein